MQVATNWLEAARPLRPEIEATAEEGQWLSVRIWRYTDRSRRIRHDHDRR